MNNFQNAVNPTTEFQQKFSWTLGTSAQWLCSYYIKAWGSKIYVCAKRPEPRQYTLFHTIKVETLRKQKKTPNKLKPQCTYTRSASGQAAGVSPGNLSNFSCEVELSTSYLALPTTLQLSPNIIT